MAHFAGGAKQGRSRKVDLKVSRLDSRDSREKAGDPLLQRGQRRGSSPKALPLIMLQGKHVSRMRGTRGSLFSRRHWSLTRQVQGCAALHPAALRREGGLDLGPPKDCTILLQTLSHPGDDLMHNTKGLKQVHARIQRSKQRHVRNKIAKTTKNLAHESFRTPMVTSMDEASKEPSRLSQVQGLGARRGLVNNQFKGSRSPRLVALRNLRINTTKSRVSRARKSPPHVINTSGGCKGKLEGGSIKRILGLHGCRGTLRRPLLRNSDKRRTLQRHIIKDSLVVSCTWKSQGMRGVNARTAKAIIDSSSSAGSRRRGSTKPAIVHGVASPTSQKSGDGVLKSLVLEIPREDETETCGTNTPKDVVQQRQRPGAIARKAIEGNKCNLAEAFGLLVLFMCFPCEDNYQVPA